MGAGASSTDQFIECVGHLKMYLEEAGRDPSTFAISKRVLWWPSTMTSGGQKPGLESGLDNGTRTRTWRRKYQSGGAFPSAPNGLAKIVEAGAEMVMLNPVFEHTEHLEALAQEVIPQVLGGGF